MAPPSVDLKEDGGVKGRGDAVTLEDNALIVDISDAMSEREKVLFTVHTKVRRRMGLKMKIKLQRWRILFLKILWRPS